MVDLHMVCQLRGLDFLPAVKKIVPFTSLLTQIAIVKLTPDLVKTIH